MPICPSVIFISDFGKLNHAGFERTLDMAEVNSQLRTGDGEVTLTAPEISSFLIKKERQLTASSSDIHGHHWLPSPR